ncbi:MAG: quinoprotein dehydrogenase-associated SoxYZ-like carrier [Hyphomicrobiaceae bacterium]|nr:quinoprotein dehydrogenase-associated SoxYZ-like carrier [Hyphomicrobiaceae bacterium]
MRSPTLRRAGFAVLAISVFTTHALPAQSQPRGDPLHSVMWEDMRKRVFGAAPIVFDDRIVVSIPSVVENQAQVPVTVDARRLGSVERLVVLADLNPIQEVLTLTPVAAAPFIAFRMKVEQGTPVRAAALMADGTWRVGGVYLDAAGGGCSAPAMARNEHNWAETVGQTQGRVWRNLDGTARLSLRVRHPMDTGLARDNTPAFFIETLDVRGQDGTPLATLGLHEPISEDPTLTLEVRLPPSETAIDVTGRDNNGSTYRSRLPAGWRQSALPAE